MYRGYVKNWRKIKDSAWYKKPIISHLAQHLIREANHKDTKTIFNNKPLIVKKGQLLTGRKNLSKETGLSQQNIRTALVVLSNCQFLTIKSTNRFSIITILNYDIYQCDDYETNQLSNQQVTNKQPTSNQQVTTSKELKEFKKNEKNKEEEKKSIQKKKFCDLIYLHDKEYENLCTRYGAGIVNDQIEEMDNYLKSIGNPKKYKDHNATLHNWCKRKLEQKNRYKPKQERTKVESNIDWDEVDKRTEVCEL